jgi:hypothetical protein
MKKQLQISDVKEEALKKLEIMFTKLKEIDYSNNQHMQLWGTILGSYGCRLYPVFEEALPYLHAGLQIQLQDLGLIAKIDFSSCNNIKDVKDIQVSFQSLQHWLITTHENKYPELLKLADDEKLTFAKTLLSLGATYSNLPHMIKEELHLNEESFLEFKTRFHRGIKELLCSMDQTPAIQKELGELYYNIFPGLFLEACKLKDKKDNCSIEEIEESFKIRWKAAEYNPHKSMQARINNLLACYLSDFKEKMDEAKQASLRSIKLWEEVLSEPDLTLADRELYKKLSLNAKSVYGYILREQGVSFEELDKLSDTYREFYETNKDRDPYSMIHLIGLCKIELHKKHKDEVLKWIAIIEEISQKYPRWSETASLLKQAQDLRSKAQQL